MIVFKLKQKVQLASWKYLAEIFFTRKFSFDFLAVIEHFLNEHDVWKFASKTRENRLLNLSNKSYFALVTNSNINRDLHNNFLRSRKSR